MDRVVRAVKYISITSFVVAIALAIFYLLSPAASQARAESSLATYLGDNKTQVHSCASDSDNDGYASCQYGTLEAPVSIQCNSSFMSYVPVFGSKSCKSQESNVIKLK